MISPLEVPPDLQRWTCDPRVMSLLAEGPADGLGWWPAPFDGAEWLSQSTWKLLGYPADGQPDEDAMVAADQTETRNLVNAASDRIELVVRARHATGPVVRLHRVGLVCRQADGRPEALFSVFRRTDDSQRVEDALQAQIAQLRQDVDHLQDCEHCAYAISHDLRAPLRGIEQLASWIQEDLGENVESPINEHLDLLRLRAQRMKTLLDGLLRFARADHDADTPDSIDLPRLVEDIWAMLVKPGFELIVDIPPIGLVARQGPLQQIMQNLLDNALRHHDRETGTVVVRARPRGDRVFIDVIDDGPGIPEELRGRVFDMFSSFAPSAGETSTGMGLAIVRRLIRRSGGQIALSDHAPRGTVFSLSLPLIGRDERLVRL